MSDERAQGLGTRLLQSVQVGFVQLPRDVAKNIKVTLLRQWHTSRDKFYHAFSALFVLQATIAVVEDWERGYTPPPVYKTMYSDVYY